MKKICYFIVLLVSLSIVFVACDNGNKPNDKYENATQLVEALDAYYSSETVGAVSNYYRASFVTEGIEIHEEGLIGTGEMLCICVFPEVVENNFPIGNFSFIDTPTNGSAWTQGSCLYVFEDGNGMILEPKYIVSGYVEIKGTSSDAEVFVDATFEDGSKSTYYYKGKLEFQDYDAEGGTTEEEFSFDYEPKEKGEYNVTFDVCQILNNGNYYSTGSDYLELYLNGVEWLAMFDLFAPINSGENVFGTYTIVADQYDAWCGVPSAGGDLYGDTPSYFGTNFNEEGYYTTTYFVVSGNVKIAADGVVADVTSYYGSKIKGVYNGEVVVETGDSQQNVVSDQRVAKKRAGLKLVKASAEDLVYFSALRNRMYK